MILDLPNGNADQQDDDNNEDDNNDAGNNSDDDDDDDDDDGDINMGWITDSSADSRDSFM